MRLCLEVGRVVEAQYVYMCTFVRVCVCVYIYMLTVEPFFCVFFSEKYVNIILKMEDMLKSWFPNVQPQDQPPGAQTEHEAPPKKLKVTYSTCTVI